MADGVLVTNRYLEIVLHNSALMRLFGFPASLPEPCALPGDIAAEGLDIDLRAIVDSHCEEGGLISREFSLGDKYINAVSAPIPGLDNQILGTVTLFKDISVYKQLNEIKSNFVQLVSHELRSPLASIEQLLAVVLEGLAGDLTERQRDLLNRSQLKIKDLLDLIADLLDVARIESCQEQEKRMPVNLAEVLDHIIRLMKPRAESQNILLRLEIQVEQPLVEGDPRCMEELFSNLISNAINYSPDGGEVVVSAVPSGNFLQVEVRDTGVGIEPEEIPKIFNKFYRIKNPRTRHVRGSGLGLAIVERIVESHGGSVEVESTPGLGTTFSVLLPALR
jgi:signal transduction histidine kinase